MVRKGAGRIGLLLVLSVLMASAFPLVAAQGSVTASRESATCVEDCMNLPFACFSMPRRWRYYIPHLSEGLSNCIIDCIEIYVTFPFMFTLNLVLTYLYPCINNPLTGFVGRNLLKVLHSILLAGEGPIIFLLEKGLPLMLPMLRILYHIPVIGPGLQGTMEGFLYTGEGGARATYLMLVSYLGTLPEILWRR
jgi:hypothetical protein